MKIAKRRVLLACTVALLSGAAYAASGVTIVPWPIGPSNDDCDQAPVVGDARNLAFTTDGATFDGPGHCMTSPNIWFRYVAPGTGEVTVSLAGSLFDTKLAVYRGADCDPRLSTMIECNDDFGNSLTSQVKFQATAGATYLIEIGGFSSTDVGRGVLNITSSAVTPPPKDDCASAIAIGDVTNRPFDTTNATFDGPGHCMTSPNIWYSYTATCTGNVTVSLLGSSFDTMLAVYNGGSCYPTLNALIECNDDAQSSFQSEITFAAITGRQYLIEIGGYGSAKGQGVLNISCQGDPGPLPSKDDCASARAVGDVVNLPFDTRNATFDGPGLCMRSPNIWFCYAATCKGQVTVSLLGSSFDTMLAVYDGCECPASQSRMIECNDDFASSLQSQITFDAVTGNRYLIEVGGYGSAKGQGVLTIRCEGAVNVPKPDLGDAPDSSNRSGRVMRTYGPANPVTAHFPTVFDDASGVGPIGPFHVNDSPVAYLGNAITAETEADREADEDGENNIRPATGIDNRDRGDDGVALPLVLPNCGWATIDYEVTVVEPGTDLWVNVWLDFNRDGDWDDELDCPAGPAKEWAVQNQFLFDLPAGLNQITTPAFMSTHPANRPEQIWMRITLSELPWTGGSSPGLQGNAGSGPLAKYALGETEDYYFVPEVAGDSECPLCEDVNSDGKIDINDLTAFVSKWLANCQ